MIYRKIVFNYVMMQPGETEQQCRLQMPTKERAIQLQANLDHDVLVRALASYKDAMVLRFTDMRHAHGSFPSAAHKQR